MFLLLIENATMIFFVVYGVKKGGALGSGVAGIIALFIMLFIFKLPPSAPPISAIMIIMSIGIASGALQVSGGMDYIISIATKIIQKRPKAITIVAPLVCFMFVFGMGTAMIALSLEPIIAETALKTKVNPKGALITSVLASNMALLCSPASSSTAYVITLLTAYGISMGTYLMIVLPSTIVAILLLSIGLNFFNRKVPFTATVEDDIPEQVIQTKSISKTAKLSTTIFLISIVCIVISGLFPNLLPTYIVDGESVKIATSDLVQIFMYLSAALNILFLNVKSKDILNASSTHNALGATLIVLGLGWVGATIFNAPINQSVLIDSIGGMIAMHPSIIILICSLIAMIIGAQTAVAAIVYPLALTLGVTPLFLVVIVQCLNVNFIIPAQPTLLVAVDLDTTGRTTKASFILPGIIVTALSIFLAYGISFLS